jgi:hypothetical protein
MEKPWLTEPNEVNFTSAGYPCRIVRHEKLKHLCGYVKVPLGHPGIEKASSFDVHGGVTWKADHFPGEPPGNCHVLGFDCAHAGDYVPGVNEFFNPTFFDKLNTEEVLTYRDLEWVKGKCRSLAAQLLYLSLVGELPHE